MENWMGEVTVCVPKPGINQPDLEDINNKTLQRLPHVALTCFAFFT